MRRRHSKELAVIQSFVVFNFLLGIGSFIILLGIMIFVHELGHFIAAKLSGVYVVRFSLGFGKRIFGIRKGETDYCVSAIPFGGYVKMVGQEDMPRTEEEARLAEPDLPDVPADRRFDTQSTFVKLAISFAGPLMNVLFAIPLLWITLMLGIPEPLANSDTRIGNVYEGSAAEVAGLKPGQKILSINGSPITKWEQLQLITITSENRELDLEVQDISGEIRHVVAVPTRGEGGSRASLGVDPFFSQMVSFVTPGMAADRAGLKEGDIILDYDDLPPDNDNMAKLIAYINESAGRPVKLVVLRDGSTKEIKLVPDEVSIVPGVEFDKSTVIYINEEKTGKDVSGLQVGDVVTAVDGKQLQTEDMEEFLTRAIYDHSGDTIDLTVERSKGFLSQPQNLTITVPLARTGRIGVGFTIVKMQKFGPREAFVRGMDEFVKYLKLAVVTPYYLVAGRLSVKEVTGPVGIAVMTEQYRRLGFSYYLALMALITVHLGIINLLPIPVLDGGMILITLVESVRRKPIEEKYYVLLQWAGLVFIILIVVVATFNDIQRAIRFLQGGSFLE